MVVLRADWTAVPRVGQKADTKVGNWAVKRALLWVYWMADWKVDLTAGAKVDMWAVLRAGWKAGGKGDCSAATLGSAEHHILHKRNPWEYQP